MVHKPNFRAIAPLLIALCLLSNSNSLRAQEAHAAFWKIANTAMDILKGKTTPITAQSISTNASLIFGAKVTTLRSAIVANKPPFHLADTTFHGVTIDAKTNQAEDMGVITFKTVRQDTTIVRYHTIVIEKDSTGQFSIISWHTSGAE
jgi:hypothetical protein